MNACVNITTNALINVVTIMEVGWYEELYELVPKFNELVVIVAVLRYANTIEMILAKIKKPLIMINALNNGLKFSFKKVKESLIVSPKSRKRLNSIGCFIDV